MGSGEFMCERGWIITMAPDGERTVSWTVGEEVTIMLIRETAPTCVPCEQGKSVPHDGLHREDWA